MPSIILVSLVTSLQWAVTCSLRKRSAKGRNESYSVVFNFSMAALCQTIAAHVQAWRKVKFGQVSTFSTYCSGDSPLGKGHIFLSQEKAFRLWNSGSY